MEAKGIVAASQPKWIPVTERFPEPEKWVLCLCRGRIQMVMQVIVRTKEWIDYISLINGYPGYDLCFVTHWMPLPAPPKAGE